MSEHSLLHFGGLSTDPLVRKLSERYGDILSLRGTTIPHEEIEQTIGETRDSHRYKTITSRWRRKVERDTGVVVSGMGEAIGVGFRVLTDGEQLGFGVGQRVSAGRRIRRWHSVVASTDDARLTPHERRTREFEIAAAGKLYLAMTEARKELRAAVAPPQQQPRPLPTTS